MISTTNNLSYSYEIETELYVSIHQLCRIHSDPSRIQRYPPNTLEHSQLRKLSLELQISDSWV